MATRRRFLQYAGAGLAAQPTMAATKAKPAPDNIYAELGVRTLINGRGVATFYSGTLMPPEVHRAMERASEHFVEIVELQKAGGRPMKAEEFLRGMPVRPGMALG